jgi:hypothetical protein
MRTRESHPRRLPDWSVAPVDGRPILSQGWPFCSGVCEAGPVPTWGRSTRLGKYPTGSAETRNASSTGENGLSKRSTDRSEEGADRISLVFSCFYPTSARMNSETGTSTRQAE